MTPTSSDYRPDIDGLRALAVVLVVLFHTGLGPFTGGFIGVDVFFVISGFLITRLIVDEVASTGTFGFSRFYARRARRILPALFFTIGLSAVFAFLLFSPEHLESFAGAMLSAVASVSNIFFWQESGYFDAEAITKPLLHTWSLGVEEQFYAFWPILLVFLLGASARVVALGIFAAGAASLWLSGWMLGGEMLPAIKAALPWTSGWMNEAPAAAFFLTPFRVFEFAIGALMVWMIRFQPDRSIFAELLVLVGLAMILYAAVTYTNQITFPYLNALLPCLGTALVIHSGTAPVGGLLLSNRISVGAGLISYSIYLIHWPLLVFWTYYKFAPLVEIEKFALCAITVVCAWLMYRFVEQPFRTPTAAALRWRPRYVAAISLAAAFALMVPAAIMWIGDGLEWRLPEERVAASTANLRNFEMRNYCENWDPSKSKDLFTCQNYRHATQDIFVWGDSHAMHLVAGISEAYPNYNIYVLGHSRHSKYNMGCVAQSGFSGYVRKFSDRNDQALCIERNQRALQFFAKHRPSYVILSNIKREEPAIIAEPSRFLLGELRKFGHKAFVIGDFIKPGKDILACRSVPAWLLPNDVINQKCAADASVAASEISYNRRLAQLLTSDFIDIFDVQCPQGACIYVKDGTPLFRDSSPPNSSRCHFLFRSDES